MTKTTQPIFGKVRRIHMVGIGGIGMSSIADILLEWGMEVSGSDLTSGEITRRLEKRGAKIFVGHDAAQIGEVDVVVHTSAVDADKNPETRAANSRGIPVINRAEMLAALTRRKFGVAIAGTHGKTTTTTLAGHVVRAGDLDPTIIVGGRVNGFEASNAVAGKGDVVVVEADEFDRTFLKLTPSIAVITNIEWEHVDIYADLQDTRDAFVEFADQVPFYGAVIVCVDDPEVRKILPRLQARALTYGTGEEAALRAVEISEQGFLSRFAVEFDGQRLGEVELKAPGIHNVRNALAAVGVGLELGMDFDDIRRGLSQYTGVLRRFHRRADVGGVLVIDDYAHHPTEVRATLQAAKKGWPERRIVAAFQPHLYSRTKKFYREFGEALSMADLVVVTDVYPAREEPIEGVEGSLVADAVGDTAQVVYVPDKTTLAARLVELTRPGDLVLTMGAGDITKVGGEFARLNA